LQLLLDYANLKVLDRHFTIYVVRLLENYTKMHNNLLSRFLMHYYDHFIRRCEFVSDEDDRKIRNSYRYQIFPLCCAREQNNIEIVQALLDYANENNLSLEHGLNVKETRYFSYINYCIEKALENNNKEMVQLFLHYASQYNIIIYINIFL